MQAQHNINTIRSFVNDATITTRVKAQFADKESMHWLDIHIRTNKGIVTLIGYVPSKAVLEKARLITQCTRGVKDVVSYLDIKD